MSLEPILASISDRVRRVMPRQSIKTIEDCGMGLSEWGSIGQVVG